MELEHWRYIDKVGVELEGAWINPPKFDLHNDESFSKSDFEPKFKYVGEMVSEPIDNIFSLFQFLEQNWPDGTHYKCSTHYHFSLKNPALYCTLATEDFYTYFLNCMENWGKNYPCKNEQFWVRLLGENKYCLRKFTPDVQIYRKEKGHNNPLRRTHLNFCYGLHKTMECRLMPMFKELETGMAALKALISCIETYLSANRLQTKKVEKKVLVNLKDKCEIPQRKLNPKLVISSDNPYKKLNKKPFNFFERYNPEINKNVSFYPESNKKSVGIKLSSLDTLKDMPMIDSEFEKTIATLNQTVKAYENKEVSLENKKIYKPMSYNQYFGEEDSLIQ